MNKQNKTGLNLTYVVSVAITILVVLWGVLSGSSFEAAGNAAFSFLSTNISWFYVLAMSVFEVLSIRIGLFSK